MTHSASCNRFTGIIALFVLALSCGQAVRDDGDDGDDAVGSDDGNAGSEASDSAGGSTGLPGQGGSASDGLPAGNPSTTASGNPNGSGSPDPGGGVPMGAGGEGGAPGGETMEPPAVYDDVKCTDYCTRLEPHVCSDTPDFVDTCLRQCMPFGGASQRCYDLVLQYYACLADGVPGTVRCEGDGQFVLVCGPCNAELAALSEQCDYHFSCSF
jgi:hypothetical protein